MPSQPQSSAFGHISLPAHHFRLGAGITGPQKNAATPCGAIASVWVLDLSSQAELLLYLLN